MCRGTGSSSRQGIGIAARVTGIGATMSFGSRPAAELSTRSNGGEGSRRARGSSRPRTSIIAGYGGSSVGPVEIVTPPPSALQLTGTSVAALLSRPHLNAISLGDEGQVETSMDAHQRAWLSLQGLSVGDTFGERFFGPPEDALGRIARRELRAPPWTYTDDTEMALSIFEVLRERGEIDQDQLADRFAARMQFDRGYGQGTYAILCGVKEGRDWRALTQAGFRGMGSFGNGAAMRVPLWGLFADAQAWIASSRLSAKGSITPEGVWWHRRSGRPALAWRERDAAGPLGQAGSRIRISALGTRMRSMRQLGVPQKRR